MIMSVCVGGGVEWIRQTIELKICELTVELQSGTRVVGSGHREG